MTACLALVGCGSSHHPPSSSTAPATTSPAAPSGNLAAFRWLRPSPPPPGWHTGTVQGGHAILAYPSPFTDISGDFGSFSVAVHQGKRYHAYLSITPQRGVEQPSGWAAFRLQFERMKGGTHVAARASAEGLQFRGGRGSCVIDDYTARVGGHRFREIACIVAGPHGTTVVIAASALNEWRKRSRVLERAVSAFNQT